MIGKMFSKGGNGAAKELIDYCYFEKTTQSVDLEKVSNIKTRGDLIYVQNLALDIFKDGKLNTEYLAQQFEDTSLMNQKLKKYLWHQTFSFPIGECPTNEQISEIAKDFALYFGFSNNQMLVFRHYDTEHSHFHIVANRISIEGKTTASDSYSHLKTGEFCRNMELKYGFQIIPNMKKLTPKEEKGNYQSNSQIAEGIRKKIDALLPNVKSLEELRSKLKKEKVKMYVGRGVAFVDTESGAKFKGSELGREYSLMHLERQLGISFKKESNSFNQETKNEIEQHFTDKSEFPEINEEFGNMSILDNYEPDNDVVKVGKRAYLTEEEEERLRKKRSLLGKNAR